MKHGMFHRTVGLVTIIVSSAVIMAGCTSVPAPSTSTSAHTASTSATTAQPPQAGGTTQIPSGTKIGVAMREMVNGFDTDIADGVKSVAAAAGAEVVVTDAGGDQTKQVTQIRSLINSGVKGIVIGLGSPDALAPVVAEAKSKGIVVTTAAVGTPVPGAVADVAGNEFLVGSLGASMLLQYIHFEGTVYALTVPGAPVLDARVNALQGMAKTYPNVKIEVIPTEHSASKVYSQVQALLAAHPNDGDIAAIWVAYDQLATGGVQAVVGANRNIPVFSEDGGVEGFKMLLDPKSPFMGTVADNSATMGTQAGKYLIMGMAGNTEGVPAESFGPAFSVSRSNMVKAAELQLGQDAWTRLGTTADATTTLFPQTSEVWPVTPLIVSPSK
jgi:ribose transport system substrate-binding protein